MIGGRFGRLPHDREIWRLALPAFGALIAEPLYILADTAVVGHLGTTELAGLAVASSILLLLYSIFIFLAYGTTSTVARLIGAGDDRDAAHQAVQGMWLAAFIGLALLLVGFVAGDWMIHLFGAEGEVADAALLYLRISLFGLPAQLVALAGIGYLRGLQDTRTPLVIALASVLFNLGFEVLLIYGLGFGIGASALSTVVAQLGAAAFYVARVRTAVRAHEVPLRPDARTLRDLSVIGRDLFVRTAALRATFVLATAVATRTGTVEVAAHQIAYEIWSFLALALDAIAIAGQALIGRLLGARDPDQARVVGRRMIEWGVVSGLGLALVVLLVRSWLPDLFTNDAAVATLASFLLVWVAIMQPVNGIVFVLDGILIGAGDLRFLAWAMPVATACFVPVALALLLLDAGIGWLWGAIALFMCVRAITLLVRFRGDHWLVVGAARPT